MTNKLIAKKIEIFASDSAASTKILGDFSTGTGGISKDPDVLQQNIADVIGGWIKNVLPGKAPALDHFNTVGYLTTRKLKEFQQQGIPEHIKTEEYHTYSVVRKAGTYELYGCKNNNVTGDLPDNNGDEDWDFLANLNDIGGLTKNYIDDTIYYGGEFDASTQFTELNSPTYAYPTYSYTFNGTNQYVRNFWGSENVSATDFKMHIGFKRNTVGTLQGLSSHTSATVECFDIELNTSNQIHLRLSSNGTTFDITDTVGTKVYDDIINSYQTRLWYDLANTQWKFDWSQDNKAISDPTKVWTNDITVTTTLTLFNPTVDKGCWFGLSNIYTNRFFNGNILLEYTDVFFDGTQVIRPQDVTYIPNTVAWKGEVRSGDNTTDISSSDYIYSPTVGSENLIPIMTSNTTPTGIASLTGTGLNSSTAYRAFDGNVDLGISGGNAYNYPGVKTFKYEYATPVNKIGNAKININFFNQGGVSVTSENITITYDDDTTLNSSVDISTTGLYSVDVTLTKPIKSIELSINVTSGSQNIAYALMELDLIYFNIEPYINSYLFVGINNSSNTILEWDTDIDGANLTNITGAKRRIGDDKDIVFPADGSGNLAKFTKKFDTWEFELWSGSAGTGSIVLNNGASNYTSVGFYSDRNAINGVMYDEIKTSIYKKILAGNAYYINHNDNTSVYFIYNYLSSDNVVTITSGLNLTLKSIIGVK